MQNLLDPFSSVGMSLKRLGVNEIAFDYNHIMKIIEYCQKNRYIILGGDVYKKDGEIIIATTDSWYYSKCSIKESCKLATDYIMNYVHRNGYSFLFTLVLTKSL